MGFVAIEYQLFLSHVFNNCLELVLDVIFDLLSIFTTLGVDGVVCKTANRTTVNAVGVVEGVIS